MPVKRRHFDQLATTQSFSSPLAVIAHIDLDAFYAQCLCVHNDYDPAEPLGCRQWNALIAVNYPARKFGIKRGVSVEEAKKLCPQIHLPHVATIKKGDLDWQFHRHPDPNGYKVSLDYFRRESRKIFAVFKEHFSLVEKAGIDEGFVDLGAEVHSEALKRYPDLLVDKGPDDELNLTPDELMDIGAELVNSVRLQIFEDLRYTCSAGVARNKLLAKLGSGYKKPFNQTVVRTGEIPEFLKHFKITDAWGWGGKQGRAVLADLGLSDEEEDQCGYVRDNFTLPELQLKLKGNLKLARSLYEMVRGEHRAEVHSRTLIKSMIAVKDFRTLSHLRTREDVTSWLQVFSVDLAGRLTDLCEDLGSVLVPQTIAVRQERADDGAQSKQQPFVLRGSSIPQIREQIFEQSKTIADAFVTIPCRYLVVEISHFQVLPKERLMFESKPKEKPSPNKKASDEPTPLIKVPSDGEHGAVGDDDDKLFVEDTWRCDKCGESLPEEKHQEHQDWHFAKELQGSDRQESMLKAPNFSPRPPKSPSKLRSSPRASKGPVKKKSKGSESQKNILDFFKK